MYATSNTSSQTLQIGAKLIEFGADFRLPIEKCFREKTPEQIALWKLAYKNIVISDDGSLAHTCITKEDAQEARIPIQKISEYLKGFINETLINIR